MSAEDPPLEERFSQVYLERGVPARDSERARFRVGSILKHWHRDSRISIAQAIERRLGVSANSIYLQDFVVNCSISDFLDTISLVSKQLNHSPGFLSEMNNIFREENIGYTVNAKGGVRYYVDEELERSRASTIAGLSLPRYNAAREAFEDAHSALAGAPAEPLEGVRRSFDAVENVFKIMTGEPRLGSSEIAKKLKPQLAALPGRAADASKLIADSFSDWVNACHQYRHAEGVPEPEPPPFDLAVALISSAATYLRWLVGIDSAKTNL